MPVAERAFPVIYARDVDRLAEFYARLGFEVVFRLPGPGGVTGFATLRRGTAELGLTVEDSPRLHAGIEPGPGPRHELFVYVDDVDRVVDDLAHAGAGVIRKPADMPWGERVAFVRDPEGNVVSLATAPGHRT